MTIAEQRATENMGRSALDAVALLDFDVLLPIKTPHLLA
jgi:hypothetical protein